MLRPTSAVKPATVTEDATTLALSSALVGGMFLDGYAHAYVLDTATEDFFTLWHAIFYAAFTALAGWIAFVGYRRRRPGGIMGWFPASYRLAVLGLALFAVGGVGDGVWHTIFGIEVGIDALLSPTHLLLFAGGVMTAWTPVRSHSERRASQPGNDDSCGWLVIGTAAIITAVFAFFSEYFWVLARHWYPQVAFNPNTGEGELAVQMFFAGALATTVVILGPLLSIAGRWRVPFGAGAVVLGVAQALEALAFSQTWSAIGAAVVGGLAFDVAMRIRAPWRIIAASAAGAGTLWAGYLVLALQDGNDWPAELLAGLVTITAMAGAGLALLQQSGVTNPRDLASNNGDHTRHRPLTPADRSHSEREPAASGA